MNEASGVVVYCQCVSCTRRWR